jgi:multiple sugar transport system substrate-binding protein
MKNMILRRIIMPIALFCLSCLIITCSSQQPNKPVANQSSTSNNTLQIWWNRGYYPAQDEAIEKIVQQWQAETQQPVKLSFFSEEDTVKETLSAMESNQVPDILFSERMEYTLIPQWAFQEKLADLSDVVKPVQDLYDQSAIDSVNLANGKTGKRSIYAVPLEQQTIHIHYWRDLLEKAGFTDQDIPTNQTDFWQFWPAVQNRLAQSQPDIYGLGLTLSNDASDTYILFEQLLANQGVRILDDQDNLLVDQPQVKQGILATLTWLTDFYTAGNIPPKAVNWLNADNNSAFLNKNVVMTVNPSLSIPGSQKEDEDVYNQQIVTIGFPETLQGEPTTYYVTVKQAIVFANSPHPAEAKKFLAYLIKPENLSAYVKGSQGRYFPAMNQLWQDPFWQNPQDTHVYTVSQIFKNSATRPFNQVINPAYSQVATENIWGQMLKQVLVAKQTPEQAVDSAIARIKEIFQQW